MESKYALVIIHTSDDWDPERETTVHIFNTQEEARAFMLAKIRDIFSEEFLDQFVPDAEGRLRFEDDDHCFDATLTPDSFASHDDGYDYNMDIVKVKENTL